MKLIDETVKKSWFITKAYQVGKVVWEWDGCDDYPRWFKSNNDGITDKSRITENTLLDMGATPLDQPEDGEINHPSPHKTEESGEKCPHCHKSLAERNPSGFCDHIYYPENCKSCIAIREYRPKVNKPPTSVDISDEDVKPAPKEIEKHHAEAILAILDWVKAATKALERHEIALNTRGKGK